MDTGPQNVVLGDVGDAVELPVTKVSDQDLQNERNMARFSKTKEYKVLKEHIENRIKFFQLSLPNGKPVVNAPYEQLVNDWKVANLVIGEFQAIIDAYENAQNVVNESRRAGIV